MSVRIITDSASDMTPAEHPALRVLPLSVTFGSDVMCLYYLERSKDGLTGADLARMAGVTRAAVSRTLAHLEEGGYVEVDDSGDAAVKYRAPVRLTALGGESMSEADRIIREVLDTTGKAMGVEQREQMYASLRTILNTLREI